MFDSVIAKEGQRSIFYAFCAFILFILLECGFLTFISFAVMLFLIYIYRVKTVNINALDNKNIYAPICGKITAIDVKGFSKKIYIDVSLCDYHTLRALESSNVKVKINRGLNLNLNSFKASKINEQALIEFENSKLKLISSMCNTRINLIEKESFLQGEKLGIFLHGQVIVEVNEKFDLNVKIGDKIKGAETIIASLVQNSN